MHKLYDIAAEPRIGGAKELYYRDTERGFSFDTFFNAISVKKFRKYTSITELTFSENVTICTEQGVLKSDDKITMEEIPEETELLYVQTERMDKEISVYAQGQYQPIHMAIIICTYRREKQVKDNVDYLTQYIENLDVEIILVDNDSSIDIETWNSNRIHVIHNINNGGSGGFACGMKYAAEHGRFTHILLMDDDVVIERVAIQRLISFLSFRKDKYRDLCIAGSMLYVEKPTIQFEAGGYFSPEGVQIGYGYHYDLSNRQKLIENEQKKRVNYGGWWVMCMPIRYAADGQLPAPFFLKYDDVEYALRCRLQIITLNGVGIWHEDFGSKYNSTQEYFNTRNYLFLMKCQSDDFSPDEAYRKAKYLLLEKLCRQQYRMAETVLLAYEDYLKGEEYLKHIDYKEKLTELRKLNYEMLSEREIKRQYGITFDKELYEKCCRQHFHRYMQPLLYGHLVSKLLCRKLTITDVLEDRKEHYFGANRVMHFSVIDKKGYVTTKQLFTFVSDLFRLRKIYRGRSTK